VRVLGIDPRSLAAFRIGLGALLCVDLLLRAGDLTAHYTDAGVAPREVIERQFADTWRWSLHMFSGSAGWQWILFALAAAAAIALLVGYHTRWSTCVSWLLLLSLHSRNPTVLNGGDVLLRMLLFWSMFLPLGYVWSIDGRKSPAMRRQPIVSVATAAILLQVALMYWMSAYFKLQGIWSKPDGFERLLGFDSYARPFAYWLVQHDAWLPWMGRAILGWEIVGPLLAFSPIATKALRLVVIVGMLLLHIGIELSFTVGLFSYVCLLGWLLFIPGPWWTALARPPVADPTDAPPARARTAAFVSNVVAGVLLAYVLVWNLSTTRSGWVRRLRSAGAARPAQLLSIQQKWNMFADPTSHDGWFVVIGRLRDGRVVDLMRGGAPADWDSFRQPRYISRRAPNHRWRKFYRHLATGRGNRFLQPLADYLVEQWNGSQPASAEILTLEIHFMEQIGLPHEHDRFMQRLLYTEDRPAGAARSSGSTT
jgi:hypothetical protein